ncbi:MAG: hypothetical protein ACOZNI_06935 [Myxococcota bacterium]
MKVALVGERSGEPATFAELRYHQFREGLAGHEIVDAEDPSADVVVSAGTWGPVRRAVEVAGDRPLCVDLPGDPFADAQAMAAHADPDVVAEGAARVFVPALLRGDAFTTISPPSRHALVGQLGVLGRLARTPIGEEWVHVAPIAYVFPGLAEAAPREPGTRVALVGSFNTWFDDETLLAGLLRAMDRAPVEVEVVGGPVPGHYEAGFARFRAGIGRHAARFRFHDRLPARALGEVLARCNVGVVLDRPGYEPELGSRTRLLLYLHQGLRVVSTVRCALARELAGFLTEVPVGDAEAVAAAVLASNALPDRAPLRERYSVAATTVGLRAWVGAARRRAIAGNPEALSSLLRERAALREELEALRASPTFRILDRLRRVGRKADTREPR